MENISNTVQQNPATLTAELLLDGRGPCFVSLLKDGSLDVRFSDKITQVRYISGKDICVAQALSSVEFVIHCLFKPEAKDQKRTYTKLHFRKWFQDHSGKFNTEEWAREINNATCLPNWNGKGPLLIFVNPHSGAKSGMSIWTEKCLPLLQAAGIKTKVIETTSAGHAMRTILEEETLTNYSGIGTVGGDGLLCEAINGVLTREDWRTCAENVPIVPIPAGTGNACAFSLYGTTSSEVAVCHIIKHNRRILDAFLCVQPAVKQFIWGVMGIAYGILAETDMGSEAYRILGPLRWTIRGALLLLTGSCPVRCKLSYLPAGENDGANGENGEFVPCCRGCEICGRSGHGHREMSVDMEENRDVKSEFLTYEDLTYGPQMTTSLSVFDSDASVIPQQYNQGVLSLQHLYKIGGNLPDNWVNQEETFTFCAPGNIPYISPTNMVTPYAHFSDGTIDICTGAASEFSRLRYARSFLSVDTGGHVNHPWMTYKKVRAFTIEPLDKSGFLAVDGERIPFGPIQVYVAPSLLNFFCYE